MLSRIPGGNAVAILPRPFFTLLIAQCSLKAPLSQQCALTGLPQQLCHPGLGLPARLLCVPSSYLCAACRLCLFFVQSEWDVAEVRLTIELHSAMQASSGAVPTTCNSQHIHICFHNQQNETAELSHGEISTTGLKCCCQPRYVEA